MIQPPLEGQLLPASDLTFRSAPSARKNHRGRWICLVSDTLSDQSAIPPNGERQVRNCLMKASERTTAAFDEGELNEPLPQKLEGRGTISLDDSGLGNCTAWVVIARLTRAGSF